MRKLLLSLLLATTATTAATPAVAQRADREDRAQAREERRAKQAEARKERAEPREVARPERVQRAERVERNVDSRMPNAQVRERQVERRAANVNERGRPTLDQRREAREDATGARQQQRDELRQERRQSRAAFVDRLNQRRVTPPAGARPDRPAPPPATATNTGKAPAWHTSWRHDHRYDWRSWRDRNRSLFRLGFYFDPFGWGYRRYGVGWRLWPSYYSSSYWLNDPFMYRLPYAPWPYRWVRYYDDALLVNTMTGQVEDVMYDFFW